MDIINVYIYEQMRHFCRIAIHFTPGVSLRVALPRTFHTITSKKYTIKEGELNGRCQKA